MTSFCALKNRRPDGQAYSRQLLGNPFLLVKAYAEAGQLTMPPVGPEVGSQRPRKTLEDKLQIPLGGTHLWGDGEMAQRARALVARTCQPESGSRNPYRGSDVRVHICNPITPVGRWEAATRGSWGLGGLEHTAQ